uniref:Pentatricopeptide repeat-containing protein n=1 Tax=Oryza brachyantha TaxID=4533 RepID=J3LWY3_ORYBR
MGFFEQGALVVTYCSIINGFCRSKTMDKAERLQQMADAGVQPDSITYNSLIHGYSTSVMWKESVRVFKEMSSSGLLPDCNSLMDALCKHGRIDSSKTYFFDSMLQKGPKPDAISYGILLHGYATAGCLTGINNLFNLMVCEGIVPNHHVFRILINAYSRCGMMDKAMLIFEEIQKQGVSPDSVTFVAVISTLCRMGKLDDALDKFNHMVDITG